MQHAAEERKDVTIINNENPVDLFRGTAMMKAQVNEHYKFKKLDKNIRLWGYISTTLDKNMALRYAFASSWKEYIPTKEKPSIFSCSCFSSKKKLNMKKYLENCSEQDRIPVLYHIIWDSAVHHYI